MRASDHWSKYATIQFMLFIIAVNVIAYSQIEGTSFSVFGIITNVGLGMGAWRALEGEAKVASVCAFSSGALLWLAALLDTAGVGNFVSAAAITIAMISPFIGFFIVYRE